MFTITLIVIPQECSCEMTHVVILGQESMKRLDMDTSIQDGTIPWGEEASINGPKGLLNGRKNVAQGTDQ